MAKWKEKKDFEESLSLLSTEIRQRAEANADGVDSSKKAVLKRRKRVLNGDFEFFAWHYFPHHIWGKPSLFHEHMVKRFPSLLLSTNGCMEWYVAPRGEAKSTLVNKIGSVFVTVLGLLQRKEIRKEVKWKGKEPKYLDYIGLFGAEAGFPMKLLAVLKAELQANARLRMDFPEIVGTGFVWKIDKIVTANGVCFETFGLDQGQRGTFEGSSRIKLALLDDIITDKDALSIKQCKKIFDKVEDSISFLGDPDGSIKLIGVGTIFNSFDPISLADKSLDHTVHRFKALVQMPTNMDLWEQCEELIRNDDQVFKRQHSDVPDDLIKPEDFPSHKFYIANKDAMDKGAIVSWPTVRDLYSLMRLRVVKPRAFKTQLQNEARNEGDKTFSSHMFWVSKLQHWQYFGGCDPSMGKGEKSDPSAIIVGGWDRQSNKLHVVHEGVKRRADSKLYSDLIAADEEFNVNMWGFENNNAFEFMRTEFMKHALRDRKILSMIGVTATVDKYVRIDSLEPHIVGIDPSILFHHRNVHLLDEMDTFPEPQTHHHYDGLDALHILWMIAASRMGGIPKIVTPGRVADVDYGGYD